MECHPRLFSDLLTHQCGYQVCIHLFVYFSQDIVTLSNAIDYWKSLEITYTNLHEGEQITYCPGCGETFALQGRIEQGR
jgi:hypothetical protein